MKYISELREILGQQLDWHKPRLDCFAQMLLALFAVRSVNLSEIAVAMQADVLIESRYKRVKRFFSGFEFDFIPIARWIYSLFFSEDDKVYIAIDRTNWYWGKAKINIFMLSICYEGIAIPLFWTLLNKAGTSSAEEQRHLIGRFIETFGTSKILGILGDREFANEGFISWLSQSKIPFYIRIKSGAIVSLKGKRYKTAGQLFSGLSPMQHTVFGMKVTLFGADVFLVASKNERDELMIVVTNSAPKPAIAIYLRRWEIETLFCALKTKGWRFEETHVINLKRIEKLLVLLAIGFVWAHKIGEWKAKIKPIALKKLRNQKRPQNSFFRLGLDVLRDLLTNFKINTKLFVSYSKWLQIHQKESCF